MIGRRLSPDSDRLCIVEHDISIVRLNAMKILAQRNRTAAGWAEPVGHDYRARDGVLVRGDYATRSNRVIMGKLTE
jgi:hypothetical protein